MFDAAQVIRGNAMSVGSGEPLGELAIDICYNRGQDPFAFNYSGMPNYQALIYEIMVAEKIKELGAERFPS